MAAALSVPLIVVAVPPTIYWLRQLDVQRLMRDDAFVGRHDKILWVVVLLVANVLGALLFWIWRSGQPVDVLKHERDRH